MAGLQHDGVGVRSQRGPAKLCMAGGGDVAARRGGSKAPLGASGLKGFLTAPNGALAQSPCFASIATLHRSSCNNTHCSTHTHTHT
ncbi:hypothetical protein EYF80_046441 [Liparis tanakae]|uniref:Uncharacterized protein n=1 Tax=Liparis tanakae TaxID=230148 RepID=A0A4Z2FQ57_9TELE|nr:hypothetical protein EYF80_046441 [Liparis tanakae]